MNIKQSDIIRHKDCEDTYLVSNVEHADEPNGYIEAVRTKDQGIFKMLSAALGEYRKENARKFRLEATMEDGSNISWSLLYKYIEQERWPVLEQTIKRLYQEMILSGKQLSDVKCSKEEAILEEI